MQKALDVTTPRLKRGAKEIDESCVASLGGKGQEEIGGVKVPTCIALGAMVLRQIITDQAYEEKQKMSLIEKLANAMNDITKLCDEFPLWPTYIFFEASPRIDDANKIIGELKDCELQGLLEEVANRE
ncbi:hypothetical protein Patl1_36794 [Pistacia atlantica]|nr:hypothetical protein Patl1_36794 [Pistacia atlantica]